MQRIDPFYAGVQSDRLENSSNILKNVNFGNVFEKRYTAGGT